MAKKILVTEQIAEEAIEMLRDAGYEVETHNGMSTEELVKTIPGFDAMIVRGGTDVTREVYDAADCLKIIGRAGLSTDNIDLETATERGVIVCNAPASNNISAAEQTFGMMIAAARNIVQADHSMKRHEWRRSDFEGIELNGKTLAIFGLGRVGSLVAARAQAFGMNVVAHDPFCSRARSLDMGVKMYDSLEEILPVADFITIHLPRNKNTIGIFGPKEYAMMKDGVILVDCSRGGILDAKVMADFVAAGKIRACAVDVWKEYPCTDSPLHEFENAILTPHLVAATKEAQLRAGTMIAEYVMNGLEGSLVPTMVNSAALPEEVREAVGPYVPACKFIGSTLAQLRGDIPSKVKLTCAGTLVGCNTDVLVAAFLEGVLSYKKSAAVSPTNALAIAKRHGIRVETSYASGAGEYASFVRIDADQLSMACTFTEAGQTPRIVSLLGYKIDIAPAKHSLIFEYEDTPGRIGIIGTILGEAGINITTMQIGTKPAERNALVYLNVESEVPEEVLDCLKNSMDMYNLWYIKR